SPHFVRTSKSMDRTMTRTRLIRRAGGWRVRLARLLGIALLAALGAVQVGAEEGPPAANVPAPTPAASPAPTGAPSGSVVVEAGAALLPPEVQLVRFQIPEGVRLEILGPVPEPVAV